jgi:aryl-alcohol dehydrogenase-like predicted oxidoreductase
VESSLKRLGVERLDLFLIHEPDPDTPIEETLGALDDLAHQGKIHYLGASNIEAWRVMKALSVSEAKGLARFDWVQNNYSLLERDAEREVLPLCVEEGLGFTPFSPLAGGWLTGKYSAPGEHPAGSRMTLRPEPYTHLDRERTFEALREFRSRAEARGTTPAALAIAWVLAHPATTAVITGPRKPEHLDPAEAALGIELSSAEREELAGLFAL